MIRQAVWAGQFYEANPEKLRKYIDSFAIPDTEPVRILGMVAPHAGYMYSGQVAAETYARITIPPTVIILSPNHSSMGARAAVFAEGSWETPLGSVPVNEDLCKELINKCPLMEMDYSAHSREHSLEVQLPFIQSKSTSFSIIPVCLQYLKLSECEQIGAAMANLIKSNDTDILMVASSDMSHYEPQDSAEKLDRLAIDNFIGMNPEKFFRTVQEYQISMCGIIPATCMLYAAKNLGATQAKLVRYMTSGDVSGDYSRVVGYAGIIVY